MKEVLVACSMLEDEVQYVMDKHRLRCPVLWMERGLHQYPGKLHDCLQQMVWSLESSYDTILLGYCRCGNALQGIRSSRSALAAINRDDCIRMLCEQTDFRCLYCTGGWIRSERFIGKEYRDALKKYGLRRTERIYKRMLKEYTRLCMIETGAYPMEKYAGEAESAARLLDLQFGVQKGDVRLLEKLLTHRWDDDIIAAPPGQALLCPPEPPA